MPYTTRMAMVICAMMVLSVATIAMALMAAGLIPATSWNSKLNGAELAASLSIGSAVTAIAAIKTYSVVVTTSVTAMAMGTFLSGAFVSSAMFVRSSKPVNAKYASRPAN